MDWMIILDMFEVEKWGDNVAKIDGKNILPHDGKKSMGKPLNTNKNKSRPFFYEKKFRKKYFRKKTAGKFFYGMAGEFLFYTTGYPFIFFPSRSNIPSAHLIFGTFLLEKKKKLGIKK